MYQENYTNACKKDIKLIKKQNKDKNKLAEVVELLRQGKSLPEQYKVHRLVGNYGGSREYPIEPDWLLIYRIDTTNNLLILERTGSHSNLFESFTNLKQLNNELSQILKNC